MTLALIKSNEVISLVPDGGWADLPDGRRVSPATAGWSDGDMSLAEILPSAQEIPEGKVIGETHVEVFDGVPRYSHTFVDAPTPTECTPAQGLVALYMLKEITEQDIQQAIDSIPDPAMKYQAHIGFSRATTWQRESQSMQVIAGIMELDESDLDALFTLAVTIEV